MDRYRLKNCIILILVLMNLFLLASLLSRAGSLHTTQRTVAEQQAALLSADGISLDPELITDQLPPAGRTMARSDEQERQAATALLGNQLSHSDQGGGIFTYSSNRGAAMFRSTGAFDAAGTLASNGPAFCRSFCEDFGYEEPVFQLSESSSGTATVMRIQDGSPVYNCTVTFSITNGILTGISGTLLPEEYTESVSAIQPLSASAALTAFQKLRRENQAVVSEITDIFPCFELQSTSASMTLVPAWCIVTDTANYYVNCMTGTVTSP